MACKWSGRCDCGIVGVIEPFRKRFCLCASKSDESSLAYLVQLSDTARHELHAIYILTLRAALIANQDMSSIGTRLAATTLACRQLALDPKFFNELAKLARSELREDESEDSTSTQEFDEDVKISLEMATSSLGVAESASERLKAVPPMVRCVVCDYVSRGWASGTLRLDLYYGERMYGCGKESNQQYVNWLGFFRET